MKRMGNGNSTPNKPFWDVDEETDFIKVKSNIDGLPYKVRSSDKRGKEYSPQSIQVAADSLGLSRYENTKLLLYLLNNQELWRNTEIEPGLLLAFDIHLPGWKNLKTKINEKDPQAIINLNRKIHNTPNSKEYNIQEMTPNDLGLLGLNKPKKVGSNGNAIKRSIHLTLRDSRTGKLLDPSKIRDLNIHELTHTVTNDVKWKKDNHLPPYEKYHRFMRKSCRDCGIL